VVKRTYRGKKFESEHLENFSISPQGFYFTFYYPFASPMLLLPGNPTRLLFSFSQLKDDIEPASVL
jgi:hypothetical protein